MKISKLSLIGLLLLSFAFCTSCETDSDLSEDDASDASSILSDTWNQVGVCVNASGNGNSFRFNGSTGRIFQSDCNDTCAGSGVTTFFNFTATESTVTIVPESVSEYCGVQADVPEAFTVPWSISGNTLTLDGQDFTRG